MDKKKYIITIILIIIILATLVTAVLILRSKNNSTSTEYDLVKKTKMNNFIFLNQTAKLNQNVFIGDSITELYFLSEHYSNFIKENNIEFYNRGISGDTSDQMLKRLELNALNIKPKNLVILIGTNDLGRNFTADFTADNIHSMIKLTKEKSPETHLIVQAIYPTNYEMLKRMVGNRKNNKILEINEKLKEICKVENVEFLDLTDKLINEEGNLNPTLCYDGLHLNAKGYEVVTQNILPLLIK